MSMEISIFVPDINDAIIPDWLARMKDCGMDCQIYPTFSFLTQSGFLPFKLQLAGSDNELLIQQAYRTGFEFYLQPFDLAERIKEFTPNQNWFNRLFSKRLPAVYFVNAEVDNKLKHCRYCLTFVWKSTDIFELRMATVSAAVIAELTQGICSFPADNIWYDNGYLVEDSVKEAADYENSFKLKDIKLYPFSGWQA